jgi:lactoylglutathione lyase
MRFGWTILYVKDVTRAVDFYERAFGFPRKFLHPGGAYAELDTGATTLAFVSQDQARESLKSDFQATDPQAKPLGFEVAFVTSDVKASYELAVAAGAAAVLPPTAKPWGQIVSYVRDLDGVLVEIASPVEGA